MAIDPDVGQIWMLQDDLILLINDEEVLKNIILYDGVISSSHVGAYSGRWLVEALKEEGVFIGHIQDFSMPLWRQING